MSDWRSYHVYYADVDRLILECVHPLLRRMEGRLERRFWERHYAGGPHLRVQLRAPEGAVSAMAAQFVREVHTYLRDRPSEDRPYSAQRAAELLEREGQSSDRDLSHRTNTIVQRTYPPNDRVYASDHARRLAQDFRHDTMHLAVQIIGGAEPRMKEMLRLFFLTALLAGQGRYCQGCVSYRSHWEGLSIPEVVSRIYAAYERNHAEICALMLDVKRRYEAGGAQMEAPLATWHNILVSYTERARGLLENGHLLTEQPSSPEEVRRLRSKHGALERGSTFFRTMAADERFFASVQYEPGFLVSRVRTNLLYLLVAAVGLGPLDRKTLCYYAQQAARDYYHCDYEQILARTVATIVARHAHRWTREDSPQKTPSHELA